MGLLGILFILGLIVLIITLGILFVNLIIFGTIYIILDKWKRIIKILFLGLPTWYLIFVPPANTEVFAREFFGWILAQGAIVMSELWNRRYMRHRLEAKNNGLRG